MMHDLYQKYCSLGLDGQRIGFEVGDGDSCYCTPVGAEIIGWDNGNHFCFVDGFGEMVFCASLETTGEHLVEPVAKSFEDFLRLILAVGSGVVIQQVSTWTKDDFEHFIRLPEEAEYRAQPEVVAIHQAILSLGLRPMEHPFEYIKALQEQFDHSQLRFTNEYYDLLGLSRPDGTEPEACAEDCAFASVVLELSAES